jgi:hypothetical protein
VRTSLDKTLTVYPIILVTINFVSVVLKKPRFNSCNNSVEQCSKSERFTSPYLVIWNPMSISVRLAHPLKTPEEDLVQLRVLRILRKKLSWSIVAECSTKTKIICFNLSGSLKEALRSSWFGDDDEVKEAVHDWLHALPKHILFDGVRNYGPLDLVYWETGRLCREVIKL